MAKTNKTDFALLGLLNTEPMSGYDIRSFIQQSIGYFWQESYGQIYPALRRLHGRRLVSKKQAKQSKGPARYVYRITAKGRSALAEWLAAEPEPEPVRIEILLKLFFGATGRPSDQVRQVESLLASQRRGLAQLEVVDREALSREKDDPGQPYWRSTLRYGMHIMRARVAWCEETLEWLATMGKDQ